MNEATARTLIEAERISVRGLLRETDAPEEQRRQIVEQLGESVDRAEPLTSQEGDEAIRATLRARLHALERAERRLDAGTYGKSIRSGEVIPDDRLTADPAAELTYTEATENSLSYVDERSDEL